MRTRLLLAGFTVAALTATATACSSSTESTLPDPAITESVTEVLPPLLVNPYEDTTITLTSGEQAVLTVDDPDATTITSDNTAVVTVAEGGTDGYAVYNPEITAVGEGEADITIVEPEKTTVVTVIVTN